MTALGALPPPENPQKGEKLPERDRCPPFSTFSPFSGAGTTERVTLPGNATAALATVRGYKCQAPPEPPKPRPKAKPDACNPRVTARGGWVVHPRHPSPCPACPCHGVKAWRCWPRCPPRQHITLARWAALAATSKRLLHTHGAALHGAGWGLCWLLDLHGGT